MNIHRSIASLVIATALFACCTSIGLSQSASPAGETSVTIPRSSIAKAGDAGKRAHTNIQIKATSKDFNGATPLAFGPPFSGFFYEDPASIACIYRLRPAITGCNPNAASLNPTGGGRAIAVVGAYDDPNAYADLAAFSAQFGLAAITPATFQVVFAPFGGASLGSCTGAATRPPSAAPTGWDLEESLDVEWAHAMAPAANLYLVEAQSSSLLDLFCAVTVANNLVQAKGGGEVSMSWGSGEFSGETAGDSVFTTSGVVYFASTGDSPGVSYPSASPNVVAVGGTTLSTNPITGSFIRENVWQNTGGGPSAYESRPHYQDSISSIVGSQRGTPDIAADANPSTGVWVLDTLVNGPGSWFIVGGTSAAVSMWAGIVNAAGSFSASSDAELTLLYGDTTLDFHDITLGSCGPYMGHFAAAGWDFCSGRGSPKSYTGK